ncbi:MAG: N-acetyltransferase [Dehalococcoidales bacterium]|nr:N-acetyltransferase [Dehalococcoidales bacterium]
MRLEKAKIGDVPQMQELINNFASRGEMLARSLSEIYENIRDYFVIKQDEQVIACAALHVNWSDLAEIKSLAVAEDNQKQKIGSLIVKACLKEASEIGMTKVFCLTYKPEFFKNFGFYQVDKLELPQKVWSECYRCPKFPDCDEIALVRLLEENI